MAKKAEPPPPKKVTPQALRRLKEGGEKITMLTAYDWLLAGLLEQAGVEVLLVGDSFGIVVHRYVSTLPVSLYRFRPPAAPWWWGTCPSSPTR